MPTTTGKATDFIQFTRASNATVTDADGKIKWDPHNLLLNSESFDASSWAKNTSGSTSPVVTANSGVAPNGTTTADTIAFGAIDAAGDFSTIGQSVTTDAASYTGGVWIKGVAAGDVGKIVRVYFSDGGPLTGQVTATVSAEWQYVTTSAALTAGASRQLVIATVGSTYGGVNQGAVSVYLWGAHLYRSDLGGMQANTSAYPMYNPTTPKNLLGFSEEFSNAAWVKTRTSVTANVAQSLNGLASADKIAATTDTGSHLLRNDTFLSASVTFSVYAKAAEETQFAIGNAAASAGAVFNLSTGTVVSVTAGRSASITPVGDGWYRCAFVSQAGSDTSWWYVSLRGNLTSYTGDGTSGIYLWGAQLSDSASLDAYVPSYGAAVTSAAYYGPRRDFDIAGVCKGLLVEEQRSNLLQYSADFRDTASAGSSRPWSNANVTISTAAAVAPDGTNTSQKLVETTSTSVHQVSQLYSFTGVQTHTLSCYLKAGERDYAYLLMGTAAFGGDRFAYFNLATGAVGTVTASTTATITPVGNGWYRCTITATSISGGLTASYKIGATTTDNVISYTGNGTSGVYLWGAQLEAGSFATSYIPTGSATATRNADVASVSTQAFPYSSTEGTLVAKVIVNTGGDRRHVSLTDGTTTKLIDLLRLNSTGRIGAAVVNTGTQLSTTTGPIPASGETVKHGLAFKENDFAYSASGGAVETDTSGTIPSGITTMNIGYLQGSSVQYANGWIQQITYLPRRISNAELQTRTS